MKKSLIFIGCLYLLFFGDYHISNLIFQSYCNDKDNVGQFIYERVGLGEEYFIPIPFTKDGGGLHFDRGYLIDEGKLLIDKHRLMNDFKINRPKKTVLSQIGPIYSYEKNIVRNSDGKVLSKAVSLLNKNGWWSRQSFFGMTVGDSCSKYQNASGDILRSAHGDLIRNTFYKD